MHSPYILPRFMFLDLPQDVIRSVACYRLHAHTLQVEAITWTHNTSPTCDLYGAMLMMYKMSSMSFSTTPTHTWSLCAGKEKKRKDYANKVSPVSVN